MVSSSCFSFLSLASHFAHRPTIAPRTQPIKNHIPLSVIYSTVLLDSRRVILPHLWHLHTQYRTGCSRSYRNFKSGYSMLNSCSHRSCFSIFLIFFILPFLSDCNAAFEVFHCVDLPVMPLREVCFYYGFSHRRTHGVPAPRDLL